MHFLHDTPVVEPRPRGGSNLELPILTQIYSTVDAGVPPESPQSRRHGPLLRGNYGMTRQRKPEGLVVLDIELQLQA
jgi:hypothetical protein